MALTDVEDDGREEDSCAQDVSGRTIPIESAAASLVAFSASYQSAVANLAPAFTNLIAMQRQFVTVTSPLIAAYASEQQRLASAIAPALAAYSAQRSAIASTIAPALEAYAAQREAITSAIAPTLALYGKQQAAIAAAVAPLLQHDELVASLSPALMTLAKFAEVAVVQQRMRMLEEGFNSASSTTADSFGQLRDAIRTNPRLGGAVDAAIAATQSRGPLGPNFTPLRESAEEVAHILETSDSGRRFANSLDEVKEVTGLNDELLLDLGEGLGWWNHIKQHRVTTAGIVLGYTVGLTYFVVSHGSGEPLPMSALQSLLTGGAIYYAVSDRRPKP